MEENRNTGRGGLRVPVNEAALIPQIAAALAMGTALSKTAETLGIGYATAKRLAAKEETKSIIKEIADNYKESSKAYCLKRISEMNEAATEGLLKALKDGNVQAINTHFRVIGLLGEEPVEKDKGPSNLTIIMPGATPAPETAVSESDRDPQFDN